jgi:hypothetical protein
MKIVPLHILTTCHAIILLRAGRTILGFALGQRRNRDKVMAWRLCASTSNVTINESVRADGEEPFVDSHHVFTAQILSKFNSDTQVFTALLVEHSASWMASSIYCGARYIAFIPSTLSNHRVLFSNLTLGFFKHIDWICYQMDQRI